MPRVLLIFEPPDGGVAENVAQLALHLGRHGYQVETAGPLEAITYGRLAEAGVPVHRLPLVRGYGSPGRDAAALRGLRALISPDRHDLVHCHSAKGGVLGRIAARTRGVPAIYSPHCFPFVGEFGAPRRVFATSVEWMLGHAATAAILCVCEAERELARERRIAPPARLRVVYNGSEPCDEAVEPDAALTALRDQGPLAATISVLRQQKRIDVLIDAAPLVFARVPDARIAIVGDGPLREELHAHAAALGLDRDERFAFLPFEAPSARHLRAVDVFVLSSGWEGLPISLLEALACGVPQVATDVGGTGEAVGEDTGVLVPAHDPEALADALVAALKDPARRRRMAAASRTRHAERFGIERMVAETAALYDDVLADRAR
jgi:glycosyltransferase involved in cell wall biosynthesis